jgi:selT/selW/selH-like putative selenoprotein
MTPTAKMITTMATASQVLGTAFVFLGDQLVAALGVRHRMVYDLLDNKMQLMGAAFFFNTMAQSVAKTDAFEVYVNGELIFSKLESKRMPTVQEILQALSDRGVAVKGLDQQQQHIQRRPGGIQQ